MSVIKDGWFGDTSRMYFVGAPSVAVRRLVVETTYEAMMAGIRQVRLATAQAAVARAEELHLSSDFLCAYPVRLRPLR